MIPDLTGDVVGVAERLLGSRIITEFGDDVTSVMLTEVEAYQGELDPASHAYNGPTRRNQSMFAAAGTLYVYRSYGIHWCMNVVVATKGVAHAVLLRGGVPVQGVETMASRRGRVDHLTDGPGKLCQAMGVTGDHDGSSLTDGPVRLSAGTLPLGWITEATPRIGITKAAGKPWRFIARPTAREAVLRPK